jgi:hypothetical protein
MDRTNNLISLLYLSPALVLKGQVWRLFTFILVPQSSGIWLFLWLYFYHFIGSSLESAWGSGKFTFYYLFGMLLTIAYSLLTYVLFRIDIWASAHYLNMSLFFAFATLFPDTMMLLFFFVPIKIKWLALLNLAFFAYEIITLPMGMNILPVIAMLNYLVFCGGTLIAYLRPIRSRYSSGSINFRKAASKIRKEQKNQNYSRKCAVCGKTDTDYPELSFRYCSRCEGFHCFCEDHINSHVHIKE